MRRRTRPKPGLRMCAAGGISATSLSGNTTMPTRRHWSVSYVISRLSANPQPELLYFQMRASFFLIDLYISLWLFRERRGICTHDRHLPSRFPSYYQSFLVCSPPSRDFLAIPPPP